MITSCHLSPQIFYGDIPLAIYTHRFSMGIHLLPFIPTYFLWGYTSCHLSPQIFYGDTPLAIYPHRFSIGIHLLPFIPTDFLWEFKSGEEAGRRNDGLQSYLKRSSVDGILDCCVMLLDKSFISHNYLESLSSEMFSDACQHNQPLSLSLYIYIYI